jgi:hypothetical protein
MKKIFLCVSIIAALYNITGCRSASEALAEHHFDGLQAMSEVAQGVDNARQSDYVGATANALNLADQSAKFGEEQKHMEDAKGNSQFWAWVWSIAAVVCIFSGGKSKS